MDIDLKLMNGTYKRKTREDCCDEPKAAKYDANIGRNDVYDSTVCI